MSDIKIRHLVYPETGTALAEYVDSLLRSPDTRVRPAVEQNQPTETVHRVEIPLSLQLMKVRVAEQDLLIPVAQIKSVISLGGQSLIVHSQQNGSRLGTVNRDGRNIPLFDLGWIVTQSVSARSHAVILRGQHFALACDQVSEILAYPVDKIRASRDQRASSRWIQGIAMDGMVPVINIPKIKDLFLSHV